MQYLNHPYHHPTIGWRHENGDARPHGTRSHSIVAFNAPENAVLVVAGDVGRMT